MTINAHTKIANILKQHPAALEAIVSISPRFEKLRNPVLRRLIAGRTSILMASKLGGCSVQQFFDKLQPLGFYIGEQAEPLNEQATKPLPAYLQSLPREKFVEMDVRPILDGGADPLKDILAKIKTIPAGSVLTIINSFEPTPLLHLLGKQGFKTHSEQVGEALFHAYFYKESEGAMAAIKQQPADNENWEQVLKRYEGNLETIDVRNLEAPLPMHQVLDSLSSLAAGKALFVYHKRVPVFLLPELDSQGFNYRINEVEEGQVHLLIYIN